ncbi:MULTISPECIES: nitrile hydratase accessory protein [unclassified Mesorhizobium]|uniref:nitrile hydratase accessory protein n=1 Tax=unclassified Mesorhizobium TaxID=325217 RepID=UPI001CCA80CB|nr:MULTISPECIES: nitrile hydratase accessory protein [unclassified Mesorhizobium]MBZ9741780.1 nitrile hydratase accessory protein [Mesorhizobium sp. CO1-1-4]MBZ9803873.1 nitrile hydratase accessory protein [Mesorhizobium sp. ES1-6]MBZ9994650.1 nitrile hydratase accessory protein [Mesorhizobium sp. BH1-1-4]
MSRPEANGPAAGLPAGFDAPVFAEPWQAEAFAMTVALHDKGLFSWIEWADALSAEVKRPGAAADGHDYYEHWLAALEGLLASKGLAAKPDVDAMAQSWERAAHATPHGKPILLENDPGPTVGGGHTE